MPTTGEDDDRQGRGRELLTPQAKAVLAVWGTVTLVLVVTYAVVLMLL